MKIAISADSSIDLSKELIEKYNIFVVPFNITCGPNTYQDGININPEMIFQFVEKNKTLPKTSAINLDDYREFFTNILKDYDEIIHICISSDFSSSFNNAFVVSQDFDSKIKVIDSRSLSTGEGMQAIYAATLRDKGYSKDEIFDAVNKRRNNVQASFVIEKLDYLYKGGRCSSLQLLGANLLRIRPSILVKNGKMGMHKKYKGHMEEVVYKYIKDTLAEFNHPDYDFCFITYSSATPEMLESATKAAKEFGKFKNIYYTSAGSTVTSHCGKNTIGILYYNDSDTNDKLA